MLLVVVHIADAQHVRKQQYTLIKGKRLEGNITYSSKINSGFECGALCLKQTCKAYNIISTDEASLCEIIGNEVKQNVTDNPQTDCYCKWKSNVLFANFTIMHINLWEKFSWMKSLSWPNKLSLSHRYEDLNYEITIFLIIYEYKLSISQLIIMREFMKDESWSNVTLYECDRDKIWLL